MRDNLLKKLGYWHAQHPWRMLAITLILSIFFAWGITQLTITMRWSDLLPENDPRTVQFNKIIEEFNTATSITVVVQGEESRIKAFSDTLAPRLLSAIDTSQNTASRKKIAEIDEKIQKFTNSSDSKQKTSQLTLDKQKLLNEIDRKVLQRVDYKSEVDFLKQFGLLLTKEDDLKNLQEVFENPNLVNYFENLNNALEKEYVGKSESISTREKEDGAVIFLDGIKNLLDILQAHLKNQSVTESDVHRSVDKLLIGEPYLLSYNKKTLIMNGIPNFSLTDIDRVVSGTKVVQSIVDDVLKQFTDVKAGLTGMVPIGHDEMVYSEQSLNFTSLISTIGILILLIISFRMWLAPFLAIGNLLLGILWAIGAVAIVVGQLNIMTQMMAVILLGLGIDFSIHLVSGFTEIRATGSSILEAMENTFQKTGKGIITGALTTIFAFLTMIISDSRGLKEMGIVTALGLFAILLITFLLLPALLVLRERRIDRKLTQNKTGRKPIQSDISFQFIGKVSQWFYHHYLISLTGATVTTLLLLFAGSKITFDHNYLNIEPEGLVSVALQDTIIDKFDLSMDYALILSNSASESREFTEKCRKLGSVAMAEDISLYLPSIEQQARRRPYLDAISQSMQTTPIKTDLNWNDYKKLRDEIDRLRMNIIELQYMAFTGLQDKVDNKCMEIVGDPDKPDVKSYMDNLIMDFEADSLTTLKGLSRLQHQFAPYYQKAVLQMGSPDTIRMTNLPLSILDRYTNKERNHFLTTVYPAGNIWKDANFLERFVTDLESVSDRATGMPPVFKALVEIIGRDGRNAVLLTIIIIFMLLWLDFRSPRLALIAMLPLLSGLIWMVGLMYLTGQQITVMNIMGLPMILGIGIDDGVHVIHRWVYEGKNKIFTIFSSTGKAIMLTSLTTMMAFGSLIFSIWRGFGQLGAALFVGVGACFLTTIFILPGIIGFIEREKEK